MKTPLILIACLMLLGCVSPRSQTPPAKPSAPTKAEAGTVVTSHYQREAVQFEAAERINVVVHGLPIETEVREQTGIIVDANRQASAQQIDALAAAFLSAGSAFDARHSEDQKSIAALTARVEKLLDAEMRATVAAFRKWGVSLVLIGVAVGVAAKMIPLGALIAGAGFLLLALAQIWVKVSTHPWFDAVAGALIIGIVGGIAWAVWHAYRKGDLTKKALAEADKMRGALAVIVPEIDSLKGQLGEAFKPTLSALKGKMDVEHRKVIKRIRHEVDSAAS